MTYWTKIIVLLSGAPFQLPQRPVITKAPTSCYMEALEQYAEWVQEHPGVKLLTYGCTRRKEQNT
jgi:hypothetical protein